MNKIIIIFILSMFLVTACAYESSNDAITLEPQNSKNDVSEERIKDNQFVFNDEILSVEFRDGRTGKVYSIADEFLVEFTEIFGETSFLEYESPEDTVGYIFWVTIITDVGKIKFYSDSNVNVYGTPMRFISRERYSTIETFFGDYKYNAE